MIKPEAKALGTLLYGSGKASYGIGFFLMPSLQYLIKNVLLRKASGIRYFEPVFKKHK
jgi:hypothetical protein